MIHDALVTQIGQRFLHEKRARVCLWFDEKQEFARVLPGFREHLERMPTRPFELLEYDAAKSHGQIWLKHRVHRELAELTASESAERRFLLYLPLSEDRLDGPNGHEGDHLELLEEYRTAGLLWRIGGKRPTLFRFLRQAGVALPSNPTDQRKIYDGGIDSLLAKYVAKFADRSADYWNTQLTPELVQSRLLGDVDQMIVDLAIDPDGAWDNLKENGLAEEFRGAIEERYGFTHGGDASAKWIRAFVATLALTETFEGYDEPADFPFLDRLPPVALRPRYPALLQRWLRDSEGRAAWDHWVREVEKNIDLTAWAGSREGLSFGFPHVVRLRWESTIDAFRAASGKTSATENFFGERRERIKLEAEFSRASDEPIGAWGLLLRLADFIEACRRAEHDVCAAPDAGALAELYVSHAENVDLQHVVIRREAEERGLPSIAAVADRHYASYTNALNGRFFKDYAKQSDADVRGIPLVTVKLQGDLWDAQGRRAVIIVDALRFDCALAIRKGLPQYDIEVQPARAELPTITPIGMTALMPLSSATVTLDVKGNNVHPCVDGKDCAQRKNRLAFMTAFGADCRDIDDIESVSDAPAELGELLVVFGHDQVDHIGHGSADNLVRHVELEVQRIARLVRKLHRWEYPVVHVVTDHGFVLLDESKLPEEVHCDKDLCHVRKERFALVPSGADVPLTTFPFAWDASVRVAVPPGLAFFKAEKSFSHGGAALQEIIIPHLISKSAVRQERRIGVEVVLPTYELMRTAVKVVVRPVAGSKAKPAQMTLFTETGRTLALDVQRTSGTAAPESVLATPKAKEVRLEARDGDKSVTLFFHTAQSFERGEMLHLEIRDVETAEQFPPGGIKLTVGRDM